MSRHSRTCHGSSSGSNKNNRKNYSDNKRCECRESSAKGKHCYTTSRYAHETWLLLLLLFFTLPHVVYGIANMAAAAPMTFTDPMTTTAPLDTVKVELKRSDSNMPLVHSEPHFKPKRTAIVELYQWKFVDVAAECTAYLGPKGFAGVQLSPVTEHLRVENPTYRTPYQTISYKLATTRFGSVEDFLAMSRACNAAGVRVYVDVVLNHMAGSGGGNGAMEGTAGSVANATAFDYPGVPYTSKDFHKACALENYLDTYEVRNCQLNGQPDLDQSSVTVQQHMVAILNELVDMGVAGFRVAGAKHMWPIDLKTIYGFVKDLNSAEFDFPVDARPFFYQEVVDLGMDAVSKTEYTGYGIVTDYLYAAELSNIFQGKVPLSTLINWGPSMGFLPHQDALVFVDTHDTQRDQLKRELGHNQLLNYKQPRRYVMATAFMLAHPYGRIKRIMSSYHFTANDKQQRGPPVMEANVEQTAAAAANSANIRSPVFDANGQCTPASGWVCEHRWPALANILTLVNHLNVTQDGVVNFQTYGPNHIAFCRGQKAFIAINNDAKQNYTTTVHTCLEEGIYCDVISGGKGLMPDGSVDCRGKRIEVKENGMTDLNLPAFGEEHATDNDNVMDATVDYGIIAIYIGAKLGTNDENELVEQQFAESTNTVVEEPTTDSNNDDTTIAFIQDTIEPVLQSEHEEQDNVVAVVEPATMNPTVVESTSVNPMVFEPTIVNPTVVEPTIMNSTVVESTTVNPTVVESTTVNPTVVESTTVNPTVVELTTVNPTVVELTTVNPTVVEPTTVNPTKVEPTTVNPTKVEPSTVNLTIDDAKQQATDLIKKETTVTALQISEPKDEDAAQQVEASTTEATIQKCECAKGG